LRVFSRRGDCCGLFCFDVVVILKRRKEKEQEILKSNEPRVLVSPLLNFLPVVCSADLLRIFFYFGLGWKNK
jgi:hypothetical protein